jgi:signal transduction histidine kinase
MHHAISNLLTNAIKYSPAGCPIRLAVIYDPDQLIIQVEDHGIGIPEADLNQLFGLFHRASNVGAIPGTGLGLAIVKQAVEAHRGTIHVESTLGQGSTFTVRLPVGQATGTR